MSEINTEQAVLEYQPTEAWLQVTVKADSITKVNSDPEKVAAMALRKTLKEARELEKAPITSKKKELHKRKSKVLVIEHRIDDEYDERDKRLKDAIYEYDIRNGMKPKGAKKVWYATIDDLMLCIQSIADGTCPMPDDIEAAKAAIIKGFDLNGRAKGLKGNGDFPGYKANSKLV